MTWFTADTHFGSDRVRELSDRPFANVHLMDRILISNWNSVVKKDDTVYHLGDFGDIERLSELNGEIKLLPGNYELREEGLVDKFAERCEVIQEGLYEMPDDDIYYLTHEPITRKHSSTFFCLYAHIHKLQMVKRNGLNIGTDCHSYKPVSFEKILFWKKSIETVYDENVYTGLVRKR